MNDAITTGTTTLLPIPPIGWFDYGYAALHSGGLALVRADRDFHTESRRWFELFNETKIHAPRPHLLDACLRLSKFDGSVESGVVEVPAGRWPIVDCLADGRWLVVSSRAAQDEENARVFAADGTSMGAFAVGDGINEIRCAADGTIWVGYFDEGVFAGRNKDGSWPISSSGIARFGPDGRVLWRLNIEDRDKLHMRLLRPST